MKLISLILISIASNAIWLGEVMYRGWAGLTWVSYFHWSIPASIGLVIVWLLCVTYHGVKQAIFGLVLLSIFSIISYYLYANALTWHFITGPAAMLLFKNDIDLAVKRQAILGVSIVTPILFHLIMKILGNPIKYRQFIASILLFSMSPICGWLILLAVTSYDDMIHVVKTGFALPFMVISLCFPYLDSGSSRQND
jgi:hypothetical protein